MVISGIPQGSVLAPIMFTVYINDMTEGVESYMNLSADDTKIMRKVTNEEDCNALNQDLIKINEWSLRWNMEFNIKKCSVMRFGKSVKRLVGNWSSCTFSKLITLHFLVLNSMFHLNNHSLILIKS